MLGYTSSNDTTNPSITSQETGSTQEVSLLFQDIQAISGIDVTDEQGKVPEAQVQSTREELQSSLLEEIVQGRPTPSEEGIKTEIPEQQQRHNRVVQELRTQRTRVEWQYSLLGEEAVIRSEDLAAENINKSVETSSRGELQGSLLGETISAQPLTTSQMF